MAISIEDPSNVVRNTTFTRTITPEGDEEEVITSITCVDAGTQDSGELCGENLRIRQKGQGVPIIPLPG